VIVQGYDLNGDAVRRLHALLGQLIPALLGVDQSAWRGGYFATKNALTAAVLTGRLEILTSEARAARVRGKPPAARLVG